LRTEVLSRLLIRQESQALLKGIKIARSCTPISHLLFVDDLILFAKATSLEAVNLNSYLNLYCRWSGQFINISKSPIHFSKNTATSTINSISDIFPSKELQFLPNIWVYLFFLAKLNLQLLKIFWRKSQGKLRDGVQKLYLKLGAQCLLNRWLQLFPLMP
jgi:hypothetical protein